MKKNNILIRILIILFLSATTAACGGGSGSGPDSGIGGGEPGGGDGGDDGDDGDGGDGDDPLPPVESKGIIFVAQTPNPGGTSDIGTHTATFGNGVPDIESAPRGGSLYFLEADGDLRDLLDEALRNGCDADGTAICDENGSHHVNDAGLLVSGYVVRRPRIHWDGDKVLFAMTRGAILEKFGAIVPADPLWQLYEITGLDPDDKPLLTKVANQPAFNNFDGIYGSEGKIFFISDKTVTGNPAHYPQLDEYESERINTGLWKLDPASGEVSLMDHSPSGDFGPEITPSGHLIFTRWDHLQRDQQAENSKIAAFDDDERDFWGAYTYADENDVGDDNYRLVETLTRKNLATFADTVDPVVAAAALAVAAAGDEIFPEPAKGNPFYSWPDLGGKEQVREFTGIEIPYTLPETEYGAMNPLRFNHFLPWQIRQDGLRCETYRHTGLHESGGFIRKALREDPNIVDVETTRVRIPDGFFLNQVFDDPETGFETVTGVVAPEFGTHKAGSILQFIDTQVESKPALHENGDAVEYKALTDPEDNRLYRDPFFLSDGRLIAAVSKYPEGDQRNFHAFDFRLYIMKKNAETGYYEPDVPLMAGEITRTFDYYELDDFLRQFDGALWQIEAQEVIARTEPAIPAEPPLEDPELDAFAAAGVDIGDFRQYLRENNLAAIVIRDATTRDGADITQPFNLEVEPFGGVPENETAAKTVSTKSPQGTVYPITYLQLMRGDYLRGYTKFSSGTGEDFQDNGRRILPNELAMTGELAHNLEVGATAPAGAVPIQYDGSIAALVPALRAMTWQTTDADGDPVVRERYWLTFQPGEIRVCASCHGINDFGQDGNAKPTNSPEALRKLLVALKEAGKL